MGSGHWIYALLVLATMPPMIPNSALLAGAGALAAGGGLSLPLLVLVLLASTVTGDLIVFWVGRRSGGRAVAWLRRSPGRLSMLEWTAGRLERYGVASVIAVRFVPGGRGAGGLTAGLVGYPVRSYLLGAVIAEAVFVSYTVGLGYLCGQFAMDGVARWLMGPLVSLLVAGAVLAVQRYAGRHPEGRGAERLSPERIQPPVRERGPGAPFVLCGTESPSAGVLPDSCTWPSCRSRSSSPGRSR
jgi:membrane protein DedA with SNARE-associated domain